MNASAHVHEVRRHPVRGALWGLLLGLGISLLLIGRKVIAFGTLPPILILMAGAVVGVVWAMVAPVKGDGAHTSPEEMTGATTSEWGLPVGSDEVPGGEYAHPVARSADVAGPLGIDAPPAGRDWTQDPPRPPA